MCDHGSIVEQAFSLLDPDELAMIASRAKSAAAEMTAKGDGDSRAFALVLKAVELSAAKVLAAVKPAMPEPANA